jgi:type VI secretion system secreted protein Hcp
VLTVRKSGKLPLEYFKIKIEDGRVMSLDIEAGDESSSSTLLEKVTFSFNKISIEYTPQGPDGNALGSTSFEDQWNPS